MPGIERFLEGFDIPKHGASSFFGRVLEGLERCVTTRAFLYCYFLCSSLAGERQNLAGGSR